MRSEELNLFVYGTLMVPAVMQAVTGRLFESVPATLSGYTRYRVKRHVYPGIIPTEFGYVDGLLCRAVDADSLQRLDAFESEVYDRRNVLVHLADNDKVEAFTYIIAQRYKHLLSNDDWSLARFEQQHLSRYLAGI